MGIYSEKTSTIQQFILTQIENHPNDITSITSSNFHISKQAVRKHLSKLINDGKIKTFGTTRNKSYQLNILDKYKIDIPIQASIEEDAIWREHIRPKLDNIKQNVINICQYGFTEMVNNARDHSEGRTLSIYFERSAANIIIWISDDGIGIFNKISKSLGLEDKIYTILELAKGKFTTDPKYHTGEGIFFTSRAFDNFMMISDNLVFAHTESNNDWLLEEKEQIKKGTTVRLRISLFTDRNLQSIFNTYAIDDDYGFSRTHIPVTLARYGDENLISRSQAKRLLNRFERFKEIVLDFNNVEMIGQAFADEIFRVYKLDHPSVNITYMAANKQVEQMISRVINST